MFYYRPFFPPSKLLPVRGLVLARLGQCPPSMSILRYCVFARKHLHEGMVFIYFVGPDFYHAPLIADWGEPIIDSGFEASRKRIRRRAGGTVAPGHAAEAGGAARRRNHARRRLVTGEVRKYEKKKKKTRSAQEKTVHEVSYLPQPATKSRGPKTNGTQSPLCHKQQ